MRCCLVLSAVVIDARRDGKGDMEVEVVPLLQRAGHLGFVPRTKRYLSITSITSLFAFS